MDACPSNLNSAAPVENTINRPERWNARYLRVIEEPLARLGKERAEQLPKLLATLLRSLRRIHSSSQLRELGC
eukprot:symbB.v1.2.009557.t1/scaffold604.1/size182248/15